VEIYKYSNLQVIDKVKILFTPYFATHFFDLKSSTLGCFDSSFVLKNFIYCLQIEDFIKIENLLKPGQQENLLPLKSFLMVS